MLTVIVALPTSTNQIKPIQFTHHTFAWFTCAQVNSITRLAAGAFQCVLVGDGGQWQCNSHHGIDSCTIHCHVLVLRWYDCSRVRHFHNGWAQGNLGRQDSSSEPCSVLHDASFRVILHGLWSGCHHTDPL